MTGQMTGQTWTRHGFSLGLLVLAVIVGLDVALTDIPINGSYAVAAVVAGAMTTVRRTAVVAALSLFASLLSPLWNVNFGTADWAVRVGLTVGLGALAVASAAVRTRREQQLRHMTVVAETAQRAVLRALPGAVGSLDLAARYVSATEEALVGGDLYEVADSPYGVRVIVGDVRGKGLEAVQMAATVLGAFRREAFTEASLATIAEHLDAVTVAVAGEEDFVTALLAEFHDDHTVTLVNCGHHPPVIVGGGRDGLIDTGESQPPLGLTPVPKAVTARWPAGSRILIYTDGLVETRDARGRFFPLTEHLAALREGTLEDALDGLVAELVDHAGRRLKDDLALVLTEQRTV